MTQIAAEIGVRHDYYTGVGTDSCSALPVGGYCTDCGVGNIEDSNCMRVDVVGGYRPD